MIKWNPIYYTILLQIIIVSMMFGGDRGWDYYNYKIYYDIMLSTNTVTMRFEPLYNYILFLSTKVLSFSSYRSLEVFISLYLYWAGCRRLFIHNPQRELISLVMLFFFFDVFWGARQGLAIAFAFYIIVSFNIKYRSLLLVIATGIHFGVGLIAVGISLLNGYKFTVRSSVFIVIILILIFSVTGTRILTHPMLVAFNSGYSYAPVEQSLSYKIFKIAEYVLPAIFIWLFAGLNGSMKLIVMIMLTLGALLIFVPFSEVFLGRIFSIMKIITYPFIIWHLCLLKRKTNIIIINYTLLSIAGIKFCLTIMTSKLDGIVFL